MVLCLQLMVPVRVFFVILVVIAVFLVHTSPVSGTPNAIADIHIGGSPDGVIADTITGNVYVTDIVTNNVTIISGTTNTVVGSVKVQTDSGGGAFDSINRDVYVTNSGSNTVSVINDSSNTVVATVIVGLNPGRAVFDSINQNIYVSDFAQASVSVIDGRTNTVINTILVGNGPAGMVFDPNTDRIYVANFGSNTVSVINGATNSVISTLYVGAAPDGATLDLATDEIYVTNYGSNSVTIISGLTNAIIATVAVGTSPEYTAYASNDREVYVTNRYSNTVSAIFGHSPLFVTTTIVVGANPRGIAFNPFNGELYVANNGAGSISVIRVAVPSIKINPSTGPVGTKVLVEGTGIPGSAVEITFDDNFIGTTVVSNSSFSFTLDVPQAQLGGHQIKAVDEFGDAVAATDFVVTPNGPPSLGVTVTVGAIYFPGDTVVASVLVTSSGVPLTSSWLQLRLNLTRPDYSTIAVNVTSVGSGLFRASYQLTKTAQIGTYSLIAAANAPGVGNGSAMAAFEVKLPWLSSQASTITAAGVASVATVGVALVSWRKGYFKRSSKDPF